jgi:hypothetical protein
MVFLAAPVMRTVARIELPSVRQPMICARLSVLNLFMRSLCLTAQAKSRGEMGWAGVLLQDRPPNMATNPMLVAMVADAVGYE